MRKRIALIFEVDKEQVDDVKYCDTITLYDESGNKIKTYGEVIMKKIPKRKSTFRPKKWWREEDYYNNGYNDCLKDLGV